jgi:hypothetical protein
MQTAAAQAGMEGVIPASPGSLDLLDRVPQRRRNQGPGAAPTRLRAACMDVSPCSSRSRHIRTARSRNSRSYFLGADMGLRLPC